MQEVQGVLLVTEERKLLEMLVLKHLVMQVLKILAMMEQKHRETEMITQLKKKQTEQQKQQVMEKQKFLMKLLMLP